MKPSFTAVHAEGESIFRGDHSVADKDITNVIERSVVIRFRRFSVFPRARRLVADEQPIEIGDRAFDLLIALLAAPGTLITKHELIDRVWPSITVEEGNLHVQVSALRRTLGRDRDVIRTVSGRGYMFVCNVTVDALPEGQAATTDVESAVAVAGLRPVHSTLLRSPGGRPAAEGQPTPRRQERPVVAVIDDDSNVRDALSGLLQSVGIGVDLFPSVHEFIDSDRFSLPDCLVLDVRLPGKSGLDFLDEMAKARVTVPVIFISGYADVPMSVRAMKAGAFEFLTKPVRHQDLLDAIQRAIGTKPASRTTVDSLSV